MNFNLPISPYPCLITAHLPQCATMLDGVKSKENMYRKIFGLEFLIKKFISRYFKWIPYRIGCFICAWTKWGKMFGTKILNTFEQEFNWSNAIHWLCLGGPTWTEGNEICSG